MSKYCTRCGRQNEDQAAFCVGCGAAFPQVEQPLSAVPPADRDLAQPPFATFTAEMGPGAHEHIFSDVFLRDNRGAVVCIAKRPSMLHENFEIVDPQGQMKGTVNRKIHLMRNSAEICDSDKKVLGVVQVKSVAHSGRRMVLPRCWLEDASGNTQARFEFTTGLSWSIDLVKPDESKVFHAQLTPTGGGVRNYLKGTASKRYSIDVFDPTLSAVVLAGIIAAIDTLVA